MLNRLFTVGTLLSAALFVGVVVAQDAEVPQYPILSTCTESGYFLFSQPTYLGACEVPLGPLLDSDVKTVDRWGYVFHQTVNAIVEEDLGGYTDNPHSTVRAVDNPPKCTDESYAELIEPRACLKAVASVLPSWRDPANNARLTQMDMGTILLEYLRMYECAFYDRMLMQHIGVIPDIKKRVVQGGVTYYVVDLVKQGSFTLEERRRIGEELRLVRSTIHRAVSLLSTIDRLRPLEMEITCMQQASLDIRNGMALSAEASSCMPRILNAREVLRDGPDPDQ